MQINTGPVVFLIYHADHVLGIAMRLNRTDRIAPEDAEGEIRTHGASSSALRGSGPPHSTTMLPRLMSFNPS